MKYSMCFLILLMVVVGCMNENPVEPVESNTEEISSDSVVPTLRPFHAKEENTIVVVPPFVCLPPDFPGSCSELNPILHAEFPGVISGTHIGNSTIFATAEIDFSVFPFAQTTEAVITAANGDELTLELAGIAFPGPEEGDVVFSGEFLFTANGTGRFANASGGGTYTGTANTIELVGQFELDGMISYGPPARGNGAEQEGG